MITEKNSPPSDSSGDNRRPIGEVLQKKRGRKSKAEEIAQIKQEMSAQPQAGIVQVFRPEMVAGITNAPFSLLAGIFKNPAWNLSRDDQDFLAMPLSDYLNELYPEITSKYPRLAVLLTMTIAIVIKKTGEVMLVKKEETPVPNYARPKEEPKKEEAVIDRIRKEPLGSDGLTPAEKLLKERSGAIV